MIEVVPTKSPATQKDNARELKQLLKFFDDPPAPLEAIEPQYVVQYLRQRGKTAPVRANREKALLSAIWNFARSAGYTALANPCAGVKGHKEVGRDLRAKAGTDKAESSGDILQARDQLGHTTVVMTENYIRKRIGKKVTPTR